jgi:hypothetical protein
MAYTQKTGVLTPEVLRAALVGLEAQKARLDEQIEQVREALGDGSSSLGRRGRPANRTAEPSAVRDTPKTSRSEITSAAKKRIAEAQKKRWAAWRTAKAEAEKAATKKPSRPKRPAVKQAKTMSKKATAPVTTSPEAEQS